jgi:hypothetical protein
MKIDLNGNALRIIGLQCADLPGVPSSMEQMNDRNSRIPGHRLPRVPVAVGYRGGGADAGGSGSVRGA